MITSLEELISTHESRINNQDDLLQKHSERLSAQQDFVKGIIKQIAIFEKYRFSILCAAYSL